MRERVEAHDARVRRLRLGLSLKIVAIAGASVALVAAILAISFGRRVEELLQTELASRGRLAALTLANASSSLVFSQEIDALQTLAAATLADVPGAAYVVIRDPRGQVLADAARPSLGAARPEATSLSTIELRTRVVERALEVGDNMMLHIVALVTFDGKAVARELDPLGLALAPGKGSGGARVLGSVELGFARDELTARVAAASRSPLGLAAVVFVGCLLVIYPLATVTTRPLVDLSKAALGIASGDLRQVVKQSGDDEVGDLGRSFARMIAELQSMISELKSAASALAQESEAMAAGAMRQASTASEQSAAVAEMSASIEQIARTSAAAIAHADRVIAATRTAEESSRAGEGVVEEAVASTTGVERDVSAISARLRDLAGRAGQIGAVVETVRDLADRSNLLSLNAAIQAASSGQGGAAFSVIAREMRALAEQSTAAAAEVPKLLNEIAQSTTAAASATQLGTEKARSTAALAQRAGGTIGNLAAVCRDSAAAARQIAESSRQQATGVSEIVSSLSQLSRAAEGNVEGSAGLKRAAERIKAVSARLTALSERYRC